MNIIQYENFLDYLSENEIASREALAGCSKKEIQALERKYGVTLPASYRWYLEVMGHKSGRLFSHDHLAVSYSWVLEMTADERATLEDGKYGYTMSLPADALIILGRLGEQFMLIRCNDPEDSPVWYYGESREHLKQSYSSLLEYLTAFATEAKQAIECGYFKIHPNGTIP